MKKKFVFELAGKTVVGHIETEIEVDGFSIYINGAPIVGISGAGVLLVYQLTPETMKNAEIAGLCIDKDKRRIQQTNN